MNCWIVHKSLTIFQDNIYSFFDRSRRMLTKPLNIEPFSFFDLMKKHQNLRNTVSDDVSSDDQMDKKGKEFMTLNSIDEVTQAECECCGLKEDCTADYIANISESFRGKWVCGLCSEAVKEKLGVQSLYPNKKDVEEAVRMQRDFCQSFNTTTRLNPKLSMTSSMKKIARRSFENRSFNNMSVKPSNISRSSSCIPAFDFDIHG